MRFATTKVEALKLDIARRSHRRFGSASERLSGTAQAERFDAILQDTALEDQAVNDVAKPPVDLHAKRQAVRWSLPAGLPRVGQRQEIEATNCGCGQAPQHIGEEVSE